MSNRLTVEQFIQLDALRSMIEDNDLAILEASASLFATQQLKSVTKNLSRMKSARMLVEGMRRVSEVVERRRGLELDYIREVINRRLLFTKYEAILEENGLWRKPILRSVSRK